MSKEKKTESPEKRNVFREYFELIAEVLIFFFFVMTFLLQSFVIPSPSMEDNLLIGDHVLVNKVPYSRSVGTFDHFIFPQTTIRRGMIVTFKAPPEMDKEYVKRVIALPGDTIEIINKKVFINKRPTEEKYAFFKGPVIHQDDRDNLSLTTVPANHYFCMGDNRDNSWDSRYWGFVPEKYVIGKPWRIYWSFQSQKEDYLTPGVLHKIKDIFKTIIGFITKTRWERTIKKIE